MKRTGSGEYRSSDTGQPFVPHQQLANMANAAQGNGPHPGNAPRLWTPPLPAPGTVPSTPFPPPGMPRLPLTQPPQWRQPGPGSTRPMPAYTASLPNTARQMPPAAPLAIAPPANPLEDEALIERVVAAITKGRENWRRVWVSVQGEERLRFGIASIDALHKQWYSPWTDWHPEVFESIKMIGFERLLAQKWSHDWPLISLLVKFGKGKPEFNKLLAEALNTEAGKATLLSADSACFTPLHIAVRCSDWSAAWLLLKYDDEEGTLRMQPGPGGRLAIHYAAECGADDIVALLLERKGREQRLAAASASGMLPIHEALSYEQKPTLINILLKDFAHEQVTARDGLRGDIPLMLARSPEIAALLLDVSSALPQQLALRNFHGQSALDVAHANREAAITAKIKAAMQSLSKASSSKSSSSASTPSTMVITAPVNPIEDRELGVRVGAAIASGSEEWHAAFLRLRTEERIRFGIATIDFLAERWCPRLYNWRDVLLECCQTVGLERLLAQKWSGGGPLILLLAKCGVNEPLAAALMSETGKASLVSVNKDGDTALHVAAAFSNFEAARLLLDCDDAQGTLRMQPDADGRLPIHRAAYSEAPDIVALLLILKGREQRLFASRLDGTLPIHKATISFKPEKGVLLSAAISCGMLPTHQAASFSIEAAVVSILLEDCAHEQVTARDPSWGGIPLMSTDSPEVAALLLGATSALREQLTLRNDYGTTALDMARKKRDPAIAEMIAAAMRHSVVDDSSRAGISNTSITSTPSSTSSTSSTSTAGTGPAPEINGSALSPMPYPPPLGENRWPFAEEGYEALDS